MLDVKCLSFNIMINIWFQAFAEFCMLYAFFWVITRGLDFICRRFETLCLFHFHRQVDVSRMKYSHLPAYEDWTDSVPKRRHIKSRRRVITQKKAYNIMINIFWCNQGHPPPLCLWNIINNRFLSVEHNCFDYDKTN